jgi:hypothetical protein
MHGSAKRLSAASSDMPHSRHASDHPDRAKHCDRGDPKEAKALLEDLAATRARPAPAAAAAFGPPSRPPAATPVPAAVFHTDCASAPPTPAVRVAARVRACRRRWLACGTSHTTCAAPTSPRTPCGRPTTHARPPAADPSVPHAAVDCTCRDFSSMADHRIAEQQDYQGGKQSQIWQNAENSTPVSARRCAAGCYAGRIVNRIIN